MFNDLIHSSEIEIVLGQQHILIEIGTVSLTIVIVVIILIYLSWKERKTANLD